MSVLVRRVSNALLKTLITPRYAIPFSSSTDETSTSKKKKKPPEIRINLIENSSLKVLSMESAMKLAKKNHETLAPIENPAKWMTAGDRPPYELIPPSKKVSNKAEDTAKAAGFKGLKHAVFSAGIQDHDINTKIRQLTKWSKSGYIVEVAIDNSDKSDDIHKRVEEALKEIVKLPGSIKRKSQVLTRIVYDPLNKPEADKKSEGSASED